MKFAIYKTSGRALKKAGAAVIQNGRNSWRCGGGFTLIEVMVVIVIIGILSTLAYSSLTDLIFMNRAKEAAQTIRTFTERALMDAKRQNKTVLIQINGNAIIALDPENDYTEVAREAFSQGFSASSKTPTPENVSNSFNSGIESQVRIGLSGITAEGYFAVCDTKGYCGGAVKLNKINSFRAYIKKGNNADWEEVL